MRTLDELRTLFVTARNYAKAGDNSNKQIVMDNIRLISDHCKELYRTASVMDKVKCRIQYESLDAIIEEIAARGLDSVRVRAFFGFEESSSETPSFGEIMRGEARKQPPTAGKTDAAPLSEGAGARAVPDAPKSGQGASRAGKRAAKNDAPADSPAGATAGKSAAGCVSRTETVSGTGVPKFAPECLADFIGQEHVVKRVSAEIAAAQKQGLKHIDHILLFGNRGLGKSTLMKLIAKELGAQFEFMDASQMGNDVRSQRAVQKFLQRISQIDEPVVIAFDEIHALPKHIQTGLLTLLNDRVYSYMDENGVNHNLPIKEFTFIGATTDAQDVLSTIKDRCNNLTFYLKDYTREDLAKIFVNKFAAKGLVVSDEVLTMCIDRCRSSIREVDAFVNGLKTKAINADVSRISLEMAVEYFKDIDRDPIGLKAKDLEILNHLLNEPTGVMSEDTLAARVHMDAKVLTKEFEPYLLKIGFVSITSRGRSLTQKAIDYLRGGEKKRTTTEAPETQDSTGQKEASQEPPTNDGGDVGNIIDEMFGGDGNA